jgi:hypothetical protein
MNGEKEKTYRQKGTDPEIQNSGKITGQNEKTKETRTGPANRWMTEQRSRGFIKIRAWRELDGHGSDLKPIPISSS